MKKRWIVLIVILALSPLLLCVGLLSTSFIKGFVRALQSLTQLPEQSEVSLAEAHAAHTTVLEERYSFGPNPLPYRLGRELVETSYMGPLGPMQALASPVDADRDPRPAVIWITGGFGGLGDFIWDASEPDNDQGITSFLGREIVLFLPALRGEHDNPGVFECFYGEADDVAAAVEHVARRPDVEPDRVFLMGHSSGGTNALFASMLTDTPAGVVVFGAAPDMTVVNEGEGYGVEPYDVHDPIEISLRSPIRFTKYIKAPVLYVEGEDSGYPYDAVRMQDVALNHGVSFRTIIVRGGNHHNVLRPIKDLLADRIESGRADLPTPAEVQRAFDRFDFSAAP